MASNIKFKRSAVQNRVPTTAQLELGELALNTYDGKLYTEINTGSASVVEIGSKLSSLVVDGDNGGGNGDVVFHGATAGRDLTWDASADSLIFNDNTKLVLGTSSDGFQLYHNGNNSLIQDTGTGHIQIRSGTFTVGNSGLTKTSAVFNSAGAQNFYHNNSVRIATTADGADISGTGSLKLPVGTTAQRSGSPTAGDMRYNSTTGSFEGYTNGWGELGGAGIGIGSTSVNPGSGVVSPLIGVGYTTINFVGAGLSVTGYGTTIVVDIGGAVSRKYGRKIHAYTATANQTTFAGLSYTNAAAQISVYLNGAKLSAATYTATSGSTVVLGTGASVGDEIEIICIDSGVDLSRTVNSYTATANQTTFTGLGYSDGGDLDVYLNGIRLAQSDYTANNGTSLVLAAGASVGDLLEVVDMGQGAQWSSGFGADADDIYRLNGGVGIGTTNPTDKLNIVGNAEVIGVLTATTLSTSLISGQTTISHTGHPQLILKDSDSNSPNDTNGISLRSANDTEYGFIGQTESGGHSLFIKTVATTNPIRLQVNSTTRFEAGNSGCYVTGVFDVAAGGTSSLRGDVYIPDKLRHIGDDDTAIRFPANDTVSVETGGTARVTVTNATTTVANNLTVTGNLQVDGTNTVVNSTTMTVDDKNIVLGSGAANDAAADGGGITLESGNGNKTFNWVDATDAWTSSEHIHLGDSKKLLLGASSDLQIFHNSTGNLSTIYNSHANGVAVRSNVIMLQNAAGDHDYLTTANELGVSLYYDNSLKFATNSAGVKVTGQIEADELYIRDSEKILLGTHSDSEIYFDSANTIIDHTSGSGWLYLRGDALALQTSQSTPENYIVCSEGGFVKLYHHNNERLETTNAGITVTGTISCDNNADTSMSSSSDGQLIVGGNGYTGAIALDGSNMNIYHNSASRGLVLGTNETARLTISSDGKVGISESSPQALLHLNDGANSAIMFGNTTHGYKIRANVTGSNDYGLLIEDEDGVDLYRAVSSTGTSNANTHTFFIAGNERLHIDSSGHIHVKGTNKELRFYRDDGARYGAITYSGGNLDIKNPANDHTRVLNSGGTELISFNHDTTIDIPGGVINLGTADTSSGHVNALENMTFNIDADNDDSNTRTFKWFKNGYSGSGTELMKLEESGLLHTVQDYPNIRPALDFNFAAEKKLDPRMVFERPSVASYTDEKGIVRLVGDNTPRFDHDPFTGECKGLLIEDTRTSLLTASTHNDSTSHYQQTDQGETITGPDGVVNSAREYTANSNASTGGSTTVWANQNVGVANGISMSCFVKITRGTSMAFRLYDNNNALYSEKINLAGGVISNGGYATVSSTGGATSNGVPGSTSWELYPNGWVRLKWEGTSRGANATSYIQLYIYDHANSNGSNVGYAVWGFQVEAGLFCTSYIPKSTTAAATREEEFVSVGGDEHSDIWNRHEGTYLIDYKPIEKAVGDGVIIGSKRGSQGSGYPWPLYRHDTANTNVYKSYDLDNGIVTISSAWADQREVWALGFNGTNGSIARNGTQTTTNNTNMKGLIDTDSLWLGSSSTGSIYSMHVKRFMYYAKRITDSQLITLTSQ